MSKKTAAELAKTAKERRPEPAPVTELLARACKFCGNETANPNGLCGVHQNVKVSIKEEKEFAKALLEKNAHRYAELHVRGAEIAAAKGDTRPAEWALLHTRTIEPIKGNGEGGSGIHIQIGVVLPGLKAPEAEAPSLPALEAEIVREPSAS